MSSPTAARYDHIDALRAIAALLVLVIHMAENLVLVAGSGGEYFIFARDIGLGGIGVTIFFLISGFVIPASLHADRPIGDELRVFAIRRFFRLYPAFWASVPFALVAIWWAFGKHPAPDMIVANLTMVARPLGFQLLELPYWTLFVELAFYALCAALFALGLLRHASVLLGAAIICAVACAAGYIPGVQQPWTRVLYEDQFVVQLSIMFCGALLRRWHDGTLPEPAKLGSVGVLTFWLILPFLAGLDFPDGQSRLTYSDVEGSKAIGIALFVLFAFGIKLRFRPLAALGQASYSLYLFHSVVAFGLLWLAQQPGFEWLTGWHVMAYVGLGALLSLPVAFAGYALIERPAIGIGRHLSRPAVARVTPEPPRVHA